MKDIKKEKSISQEIMDEIEKFDSSIEQEDPNWSRYTKKQRSYLRKLLIKYRESLPTEKERVEEKEYQEMFQLVILDEPSYWKKYDPVMWKKLLQNIKENPDKYPWEYQYLDWEDIADHPEEWLDDDFQML